MTDARPLILGGGVSPFGRVEQIELFLRCWLTAFANLHAIYVVLAKIDVHVEIIVTVGERIE